MLPAGAKRGARAGSPPAWTDGPRGTSASRFVMVKESGMRYALGPIRGAATLKKREIGYPCKPGTQRSLVAIFGASRF